MKVIIDIMSGDNAPAEILKGALLAAAEYNCEIVLVGDTDIIKEEAKKNSLHIDGEVVTINHASEVIQMDDPPMSIRSKRDSSMVKALTLLASGNGDALVSAGNTGALYTGASIIVSRIKGFRKSAIATLLPFSPPVLLIDCGANINVTDENLEQFALIGAAYLEKVMNVSSPRIGLLNNGSERTKGSQTLQETYYRLEENPYINFIGNVESRDLPFNVCDVLVTDGFSGNLILKYTEGLSEYLIERLSELYSKNMLTKASSIMIKKELKSIKRLFDASEYGGAPLLGISKPVIKAHGSSKANAVKNAIRQAIDYAESGVIQHISKLSALPEFEQVD